ncbi:MAG TPA: hypothetical protein DDW43_04825 [Nitrosomonas sp.]|nr:hypothetical protein [Nitrosomonas sp. PRO5]HBF24816.1 hypothetical protein [Nitrosomonas sp.]
MGHDYHSDREQRDRNSTDHAGIKPEASAAQNLFSCCVNNALDPGSGANIRFISCSKFLPVYPE